MIYYNDNEITIRDIYRSDITALFSWWIDKSLDEFDPRPFPVDSESLIKECNLYCNVFEKEVMNDKAELNKYKYFIIADKEDRPLGFVNIFSLSEEGNSAELGIKIGDRTIWRKGIATKSLNAVLEHLFSEENFTRIHIETEESNIPSLRLFESLDFTRCNEYIEDNCKFIVMEKLA